ncbi:hypothetical protein Trydic_g9289 [Trypoxylus dichotomus]
MVCEQNLFLKYVLSIEYDEVSPANLPVRSTSCEDNGERRRGRTPRYIDEIRATTAGKCFSDIAGGLCGRRFSESNLGKESTGEVTKFSQYVCVEALLSSNGLR